MILSKIDFSAYGHKNVVGRHPTTLEFTKDKDLSVRGDCIIGVNADFDLKKIKEFINSHNKKISIIITVDSFSDEFTAVLNPLFSDSHEMVIRKSEFISARTFAVKATKACCDLNRKLVEKLKEPGKIIKVSIKLI
jgi:uncharacterized protein